VAELMLHFNNKIKIPAATIGGVEFAGYAQISGGSLLRDGVVN
jgi:hypothetical protein